MNKKITVGITIAFVLIAVAITFTATMMYSMDIFDKKIASVQERASVYDKISEIDSVIRQNYSGEIDDDALMQGLTDGYLSALGDENTVYLRSSDIAAINDQQSGEESGIGVATECNASGYAQITKVYPDSAASKLDIQVNDVITKINEEDALTLGYEQVVSLLTGTEGTSVSLTYQRDATEYSIDIVYAPYDRTSVTSYSLEGGYAYIRLLEINDLTDTQFEEKLSEVNGNAEVKGLILDLRDTDGGRNIEVVVHMLNDVIGSGVLVSGIYAGGNTKELYTATSSHFDAPIVVLVNGNTSGYAELLAATLGEQENVRVVGEETEGKGTCQELITLSDGTGLYVTVCELLAAGTTHFDGTGVAIDFVTSPLEGFELVDSEPVFLADAQLKKGIEIMESELLVEG